MESSCILEGWGKQKFFENAEIAEAERWIAQWGGGGWNLFSKPWERGGKEDGPWGEFERDE